MSECPVPTPKLISAKSTVITCGHCGAWVERYPAFMGEFEDFWQCEKCGYSWIRIREGRPFSRKSRKWDWIVKEFNDLWTDIPHWDWDTVITDPPMASVDWAAIETWYRSMNIYRMFIEAPPIEMVQTGDHSYTVTVGEP